MFQHVPAILIWTGHEDFHSHTGHMSLILQAGNDVAEKMLNQGGPVRSRKSYFRYGWWNYFCPRLGFVSCCFYLKNLWKPLKAQSSEDMRDKNTLTSKSFVWWSCHDVKTIWSKAPSGWSNKALLSGQVTSMSVAPRDKCRKTSTQPWRRQDVRAGQGGSVAGSSGSPAWWQNLIEG